MKNISLIIVFWVATSFTYKLAAQEVPNPIDPFFIEMVEKNSTTLKAFKDKIEASRQAVKVGLTPSNPEVSYSYTKNGSLFGEELIISQELDFPTVYSKKNKLAGIQQERLVAEYKLYRRNLLSEAYSLLADYAYAKRMLAHSETRAQRSNDIFTLMENRFNLGDISAIELSKSKMERAVQESVFRKWEKNLSSIQKGLARYIGDQSENEVTLSEIATNVSLKNYDITQKEDLEKLWMKQNDDVIRAKYESEFSRENVALKKAEALPSFSLGYRRDRNEAITMNGVAAGISIPVWAKKNTVKQAKAEQVFAESSKLDAETLAKIEFDQILENTLLNLQLFKALEEAIPEPENLSRLKNTLEAGHVSILEYYNQLAVYYELENQLEEAQNELHRSYIQLFRVVL